MSPATVSRALSMPELVHPQTRERVETVVRELGYEPNRAARGLITGRTGNIGLIVPDLANPFFAAAAKGVQAAARAEDHSVSSPTPRRTPTPIPSCCARWPSRWTGSCCAPPAPRPRCWPRSEPRHRSC
ncbi:LacI family DNA-binding transcriptional regulator [Pseudonocardia sp. GCM10023141]|uniref:LacI family DNA-binding transcriptional regulator n=1 Tax=Pseudonocardia sp. GCM10023141 TaxID=3252653 RepID=UPI003612DFF0